MTGGASMTMSGVLALLPVASRVAGLLLVAPVFGSAAVPLRLRILMALVVGLAVVGQVAPAQTVFFLGQFHDAPAFGGLVRQRSQLRGVVQLIL